MYILIILIQCYNTHSKTVGLTVLLNLSPRYQTSKKTLHIAFNFALGTCEWLLVIWKEDHDNFGLQWPQMEISVNSLKQTCVRMSSHGTEANVTSLWKDINTMSFVAEMKAIFKARCEQLKVLIHTRPIITSNRRGCQLGVNSISTE